MHRLRPSGYRNWMSAERKAPEKPSRSVGIRENNNKLNATNWAVWIEGTPQNKGLGKSDLGRITAVIIACY